VSPWKANLTNGVIMGIIGIVYTLLMYFLDLTLNKSMGYIFIALSIFLLFYFIKSYRNNYMHGNITYGQSVGAGVIIYLYYAIISAIFMYILYTVIDPGLTKKMLAMVEEQLTKSGRVPAEQMDTVMAFQKKLMIPEIQVPLGVLFNMIFGTIISLIVSVFTKKEGNPLLDEPEKL
jgi:sensor histidine kinase YesM